MTINKSNAAFIDREYELKGMEKLWADRRPQLFVLHGRRRAGKTELIKHFCQGKRIVYYQAIQTTRPEQLRQMRDQIYLHQPELLPSPDIEFPTWEAVFRLFLRAAKTRRLGLVLDEFPYLCDSDPSLPSVLQRLWDHEAAASHLFLLLCGSQISVMESQVLGHKAPLFGRRTGQLKLEPLNFRTAGQFFPKYSLGDKALTYGILGGMPAYLRRFDPAQSIRQNVRDHILDPIGFLYNEPDFIMRQELREPTTYSALLRAIASGETKLNTMVQQAGLKPTSATYYLDNLMALGFVRREVPVTEKPKATKKGLLYINDHFFRFFYHFIFHRQSLVQSGEGDRLYDSEVATHMDEYMGWAFEDMCRQYIQLFWREELGTAPREGRVGRYWSGDLELDLIAPLEDRTVLYGEAKWWHKPVGENVLDALIAKVHRMPPWRASVQYALFSKSGFTPALVRRAAKEKIFLFDLPALYRS